MLHDLFNLIAGDCAEIKAPCDETPGHVGGAVRGGVAGVEFLVHDAGHYREVGDVAHWAAIHPPVEVPVVVGEHLLAVFKRRLDGAALLNERGAVIGVWVRGTVFWALWERVCAGVQQDPALSGILAVEHKDGFLMNRDGHEDDHACTFSQFLWGVDEFLEL